MNSHRMHRDSFSLLRCLWDAILITFMLAFWLSLASPAGAQDEGPPPARDYVSCGHFETQAGAQETLDSGLLDGTGRASLDGDGDGIACEEAFSSTGSSAPPPAPSTVNALPRTGSGPATHDIGPGPAAFAAAIAVAGGLAVRMRVQQSA